MSCSASVSLDQRVPPAMTFSPDGQRTCTARDLKSPFAMFPGTETESSCIVTSPTTPGGPCGPTGPTGPAGPLGSDPRLKSQARRLKSRTFDVTTESSLSCLVPTHSRGMTVTMVAYPIPPRATVRATHATIIDGDTRRISRIFTSSSGRRNLALSAGWEHSFLRHLPRTLRPRPVVHEEAA